jgi:hypothetical protein
MVQPFYRGKDKVVTLLSRCCTVVPIQSDIDSTGSVHGGLIDTILRIQTYDIHGIQS